ncbi:hypothetical protein GCM10027422_42960 [Hymenobacter arcticus]
MRTDFDLQLIDLHWTQGGDDPDDKCAHGHVLVRIGSEIVADATTLDVTVSATALYLLRSLAADYLPDMFPSQLLPCCGHYWFLDNGPDVLIMGCANGIDWTIMHVAGNLVRHTSAAGQEVLITENAYRRLVLAFADQVEQFYASSLPKNLPEDADDRQAYLAYWQEWHTLRAAWN